MRCGGFATLLGLPAIIATVVFILRMRWLKKNSKPHNYGRTGLIYWPSQIFIALACLILVFHAGLLIKAPEIPIGLLLGVVTTLVAWILAIPLNTQEHKYETRSSDRLFIYYLVTLATSFITLYIISDDIEQEEDHSSSFRITTYFIAAIAVAFFFESFPRKYTKVQQLARENEHLSERQQANLLSRLTFNYFQPIVSLGASRPLTGDDLNNITPDWLLAGPSYEHVAMYWEKNKAESAANGTQPSFLWTVLRAYRPEIAIILVIRLLGYTSMYMSPVLFGWLLKFIEDYHSASKSGEEPPPLKAGFMIAGLMLFFNLTCQIALSNGLQKMTNLGSQSQAATIGLIYRKALRLSPQARQSSTIGEITNHMSVDAGKWIDGFTFELIVSITLLFRLLGWSLFAGLAVFGVLFPIQAKSVILMNGSQDELLKWMDERIRITSELLSNIKIVKLYNWESSFRKKIDNIRANELAALKVMATIRSLLTIIFSSVTLMMAFFTFWAFAYYGGPNMTPGKLSSEIVFVSITLFGIMSKPLGMITHSFSASIGVNVGMKRIQNFLLKEEIDPNVVRHYSRQPQPTSSGKRALAVEIENATFMWERPADVSTSASKVPADDERQPLLEGIPSQPVKPTLLNINLQILDGNLTAIVGRIGQGKSSLLNAIIGEMYKTSNGTVSVYGELAYVPQQAWIINATIKDNILLGKSFDQDKYNRIVYACGLKPDFEMLSAGDQTEIGERGINLSGGQKQRVSLARAVYQDADIYLLDDPLSAVDAHVDQHLWENVIGPDGLLKDKTRLLVTHGIHHLEEVDQIVVLKNGAISEQGEYKQLLKAQGPFYQLIKEFSVGQKKRSSTKKRLQALLHGNKDKDQSKDSNSTNSDSEGDGTVAEESSENGDKYKQDNNGNEGGLIGEEKTGERGVGWDVVLIYARAVTYPKVVFCILIFILSQACHIGTNFWLRFWISDVEYRDRNEIEPRPHSYYLFGYGRLIFFYLTLDIIVNYTVEVICGLQASKVIFDRLLSRVLRLPMSFFDTTPMGRIVNRFSSDIDSIDTRLPEEWNDLFSFIINIGGTMLIISYSTPVFLIAIPPLLMTYLWVQHYFILSSSSLKRLSATAKSPLFQHFSETLSGVSCVRATRGLDQRFIKQNEVRTDVTTNRFHAFNLDNRWLQVRLEALGGFAVFAASALAVWNAADLDPSLVGLALSYALNLTGTITFLVRTANSVQNSLVSVERVDEYSHKPIEAPEQTGAHIPQNWPSEGRIVFKNYSARYREGLDLVVKDISFTVEPTQSVGIVGRTGAG
ncbi:hypothetical protein BGZ76_003621, partial [Entomortierella beljakovae]